MRNFLRLLGSLPQPEQTKRVMQNAPVPMPSTTMDEQALLELLKEAMIIAEQAQTEQEIDASIFELLSLKTQFECRQAEQVLYYKRLNMPRSQILDYQAAMQICFTSIEQTLLDLRHKNYLI